MIHSTTCSETASRRAAPLRRGTVLAFLALVLVVLVGFLALAIDIGMLAIARAQAQNAADVAALTAARTLNGDPTTSYNQALATTNAQAVVTYNTILHQPMTGSQVTLTYGTYDYNQSTQTFGANYPGTANMPYTAVTANVTAQNIPTVFGKVLGISFLPAVSATAQAAHRPRDIALVMDLSGSMRFGTCNRFDFYTTSRTSNNPDPLIPTFGPYSATSTAAMQGPSTVSTSATDSYAIPPSNVTVGNSSYTLTYINNFYQNAAYASTLVRAFDSYASTDNGANWSAPSSGTTPQLPPSSYASTPNGDVPLWKNGSTTTYAKTVSDVVSSSGSTARNAWWELDGYSGCTNGAFNNADLGTSGYPSSGAGAYYGYTQGPGYYGETFFIWPPDPRRCLSTTGATSTGGTTSGGGADVSTIRGFLTDFGYLGSDFTNAATGSPLCGIYSVTSTSGSRAWPWPNDGGSRALGAYLTKNVSLPGRQPEVAAVGFVLQEDHATVQAGTTSSTPSGTTSCDWAQCVSSGTDDNDVALQLVQRRDEPAERLHVHDQLQRDPPLDRRRAEPAHRSSSAHGPNQVLRGDPDCENRDLAQLRKHRSTVLGGVHRLRPRLSPDLGKGVYQDVSNMAGYGTDFAWGTVSRSAPPASSTQYMGYSDNPARPRLRFWFGPLMMVDYMNNYNMDSNVSNYFCMQPGDSYEAPLYTGKQAFLAAVDTMQDNHPNDWATVVQYSWPRTSATDNTRRFNCVSCPLGTNYAYAKSALLFPFSTINADGTCNNTEVTPYDADPATGTDPLRRTSWTRRGPTATLASRWG